MYKPDMSADTEKDYYKHTGYELGTVTEGVIVEWAHLHPGKRLSVDPNILTVVLILAPETDKYQLQSDTKIY